MITITLPDFNSINMEDFRRRSFRVLKQRLDNYRNQLNSIKVEMDSNKAEIIKTAKNLKTFLAVETASMIDIDYINLNNSHISVSSLRSYGLKTIADLIAYKGNLTNIKGIAEISKSRITYNLRNIENQISEYVKTTISPDKKNEHSQKIIFLIETNNVFSRYETSIKNEYNFAQTALLDLALVKKEYSSISCLFSKRKKESSKQKYLNLLETIRNHFNEVSTAFAKSYNSDCAFQSDDIWNKFLDNPSIYEKTLNQLNIEIAYSIDVPVFPLARRTFLTESQYNYIINLLVSNHFTSEEVEQFKKYVENKCNFATDITNANYKLPNSVLQRINYDISDYYKIVFDFKYSSDDVFKYVYQTFQHSKLPLKKTNNGYIGIIDIRSIEFAYIDWLRRNHGVAMSKIWNKPNNLNEYLKANHIDELFNLIDPLPFNESIYLKQVCNYYNHWKIDESIVNQILLYHSEITTELYVNHLKNYLNKEESKLFKMIKSYYPDALFQYRSVWLHRQSLDIYIPSLKVAIEYQGQQHYIPYGDRDVDFENFKKQQTRDINKKQLCIENGVRLIYWKYDKKIDENSFKQLVDEIKKQIE